MYFRGMGDGESDYWNMVAADDAYQGQVMREAAAGNLFPALPVPATAADSPGMFSDWSNTLSTAIKTWGQVQVAQSQADVAKVAATRQPLYYSATAPGATRLLNPFTSGGAASIFGIPAQWILLGAAGFAAFYLLSDGKKR